MMVDAARNTMAFRVGKATVFALAKRANQDWSENDMVTALTKESLSIAADKPKRASTKYGARSARALRWRGRRLNCTTPV